MNAAALNFSQPAPYGYCARCRSAPAVHHAPDGSLVCREHLPPGIIWAPFLGKQERFMAATERYVLFGGGAGPGKSDCALRKWIRQWNVEHQRWLRGEITESVGHCIIFRRQLPELQQLKSRFKRFYKLLDAGAEWNEAGKTCTFSCGYIVQFAGIDNEDDWEKYYGPEYTMVIFDEATQFTVRQIEEIDTRIRSTDPVLKGMLQLILCTNPVGHETKLWLRQRYVEAAEPEQPVMIRTKLRDGRTVEDWQVYIPATVYDNPELMKDGKYEANLLRRSPEVQRALLQNDWYTDAGSWAGADWDPLLHVCKPFKIPRPWLEAGFKMGDYGFANNSSIQWAAVDFDGNMIIYRSLTIRGKTARELAVLIRELESEPLVIDGVEIVPALWDHDAGCSTVSGPMDQSLWSRVGETGPSRGEILDEIGCMFFKADRNRHSASDQLRSRLRRRTANAEGELVIPGIRWFSTCKSKQKLTNKTRDTGPIVTIPAIAADEGDPDLWDTKADDHDIDAAGYGCLHRMLTPDPDDEAGFDELLARRNRNRGGNGGGSVSGFPGGR